MAACYADDANGVTAPRVFAHHLITNLYRVAKIDD